ncbi:MAG: homogentisate phytyltransferase [Brasilonema octagenarum HA4186-MV1]|jgi:homogentisate phytyltransferase/homogentisate geranylgeranyltransferase|uniref:Homogentisate phytyltransferase n=1 Tax=Brasilonema octagenarum UFV-OR1 TaxID=417115 RepID=A0ABX1M7L3_9CYAN|nr:homogentisate phytyltransferase [Brasilonema octagenarum]MBW4626468.1 homogentisate phytyltransferase [Brasilonema octagenarum HA4186-MV1]NMF64550.1 homogentisate phytyltransferase [Brasilonema octagenarum UFV-OR1]
MDQVSSRGFQGNWFYSFWKFSRPHTIIGTSLSVLGLFLIAVAVSDGSYSLFPLLGAWVACLCGNIYIVGLNQLEDVAIDKINKPHLPVAAGEFSLTTGKWIVAVTGVLALVVALLQGSFLFGMVAISLAIGTAYSLPPIRLKRFPFWAAVCIFSVRGAIVNLGLYLHYSWVFEKSSSITAAVWVLTVFVLVFTFAIAIFKDVPDMEGDLLYNIKTLTLQIGKQAVFNLALWVITVCYLGMIGVGVLRLAEVNSVFLVMTHLVALVLMWWRSRQVDLQEKSEIARFYQFIWKLFFLEYLIFPMACLLA